MESTKKQKTLLTMPLYVLFLSLFPPLAFFVHNIRESTIALVWKPLVLSIAIGGLVFGIMFLLVRDWEKAGLITALGQIIFFSYGHVYQLIKGETVLNVQIGRHRFLLVLSFIIFLFGFWIVTRKIKSFSVISRILNLVFFVLVLFQIGEIGFHETQTALARLNRHNSQIRISSDITNEEKRDVYFILLDGYMRSDWLEDSLDYDNSEFIKSLEDTGFYVASCSRSNYSFTRLSMTSEFNLNYLQVIFDDIPRDIYLQDRLRDSEVRQIFSDLGYEFVTFENFYPWLNITDSDYYIKPDQVSSINTFDLMFLETTILTVPYNLYEREIMEYQWSPDHEDTTRYATLVQFILDYLKDPPQTDSPVFVYAHILSPHYPYVFNADGSINYDWEQTPKESLRTTYTHVNNEVVEIAKNLKKLDPEPIIIIQSDHGTGEGPYKHLILNAYNFPDGGEGDPYPTISPVNTFRLLFSKYFGLEYPFLEDESYQSEKENGRNLILVEDPYPECRNHSD